MGNLFSESLRQSMYTLYVKMRRKRSNPKINHHTKQALDNHIFNLLKLLFFYHYLHFMTEEESTISLHKDLALLIYEMCTDTGDQKPSQEDLDKFIARLADELYKKFPHYKK